MSGSELSFGWERAEENDGAEIEDDNEDSLHSNDIDKIVIKKEPNLSPIKSNEELNATDVSVTNRSFHNSSIDSMNRTFSSRTILNNDQGDRMTEFLTQHPRLASVSKTNIKDIGDNDEVWLVQCPSTFDLSALVGLPILQNEKKGIKISSTKYECVNFDENQSQLLNVVMPPTERTNSCKFLSHNIKGKFIIRQKMEERKEIEIEEEPMKRVPFPTNLKKRHPLFGNDYKKRIKLSSIVKEKLLNPLPKKRSKNKNLEDKSSCEVDKTTKKQSKKRKADELKQELEDDSENNRIKWESEKSIEECLFAYPSKKKRKLV